MEYNQNNLEVILTDLYNIDPSLKEHEQELISVIKQLIAAKPEGKIDQNFKIRLRNEILAMVSDIRQGVNKKENPTKAWSWVRGILLPVTYGFVGAFVIVMVIVPLLFNGNESEITSSVALNNEQDASQERRFVSAPEAGLSKNSAIENNEVLGGRTSQVQIEPVSVERHPAILPIAEELSIRLGSNKATGFTWVVDFDKQYIELVSEEFEENGDGAMGKQVFKFKALQVGQTDIVFSVGAQEQIYEVVIK